MSEIFTPFVSVIIPVYNDPERLKTCLQALEEQTYPKNAYEVIVVDNGSDESVGPIVAKLSQTKASCETYPSQFAARNKGLSLARGEVIAFTDADCIPEQDWIEKGVTNLLRIPNCGILGGKVELFFKNPNRPTAAELYERTIAGYLDQKTCIEEKNFSATANLFTFKKVFEHVGAFDNVLKSGGDKEWGRRVASFGYQLIYAADVRVAHPGRHTFTELLTKQRRLAGGFKDKNWKEKRPPLAWNYESIMAHLPPLPPVFKVMRFKNASFKTKIGIIVLWFLIRYVRTEEKIRVEFLGKSTTRR